MAHARAGGRHHRRLGALLVALSIGGCATFEGAGRGPERPGPESSGSAERTVALDFVVALGQLEGYGPIGTIVRFDREAASDTFLTAMREVLLERGYGVQLAGAGATDVLRYRRLDGVAGRDGVARHETYEIALNAVEMRRDYAFSAEGGVSPSSPLYVRGADASNLETDDSIFSTTIAGDEPPSRAAEPAGADAGEPPADGTGVE